MSSRSPLAALHVPSLLIKDFRGILNLSIKRLGRVTLIAGKNNFGKTSILEAVRLLVEGGSIDTIRDILQLREENVSFEKEAEAGAFLVSALFHGFPEVDESSRPVQVSTGDGLRRMRMEVKWYSEEIKGEGFPLLFPASEVSGWFPNPNPVLVVETEAEEKVYEVDSLHRVISGHRISSYPSSGRKFPLARFVNSSSMERTAMLGALWENIVLTEREPYVLEALQIIDDKISAVAVTGDSSRSRSSFRRAMVRSSEFPRRVPLRSFGDGMNRLFGIILSLVNVSGGILLIDEFENGLHHTLQVGAWDMVFRLAEKLNVQVLATTHSFDCVAAFARAAAAHEEIEGLMLRIDQFGDQMDVVEYTERDLQVAVRQRIEVR